MRIGFFAVVIGIAYSRVSIAEPIRCDGHADGVTAVALSPDAKLIVSASGKNGLVRVWSAKDGLEVERLPVIPPNSDGVVYDVEFSPDGLLVAIAASNQPISFWEVATGKKQPQTVPVKQTSTSLAFSPDGSKILLAEQDTQHAAVMIWDLKRQAVLHEFGFSPIQISAVTSVAYSHDGKVVAAALLDYGASIEPKSPKVQAWDAGSGEIVFTEWNHTPASAVAFSRKDWLLAAASGQTVEVWSWYSHESRLRVTDEKGVLCLAFSPDGKTLATGGNDSVIKLWNVQSGELTATLKGHAGQVRDLCFSKEGTKMVSGGADTAILIWNLPTDATPE